MAEGIGHNRPPGPVSFAESAVTDIAKFVAEHPKLDGTTAREAKLMLDRARATIGDLEAYRDKRTKPLYDMWKAEIATFKPYMENLGMAIEQLSEVIKKYLDDEEDRLVQEAEAARLKAEEVKRVADAALANAKDLVENVSLGEIGVDTVGAEAEAREAIRLAGKASAQAAISERDARTVRLGGGLQKATSLRNHEFLEVADYALAIAAMSANGLPDGIKQAILTAARAYRKTNGQLPSGIVKGVERRL